MRKVIGALVFLMIVVTACTSGSNTPAPESVFEGGTQGIVADFEPFGVEENGIFTIFDTESFPIEVVLRNKGEEDVAPGDVTVELKGIKTSDFSGIVGNVLLNQEDIEKVSEFNQRGDEEIIDFTPNNDAQYIPPVTGFFQPDVFAMVNYKYETHIVVPSVCFKEDPRDDTICDQTGSKTFFVSSAPVSVTRVEQDIAGRGIVVLSFTVNNVGGGKVTLVDDNFDVRFGQVGFSMETDTDDWECKLSGKENQGRLVDGVGRITCKLREALEKDTLFTKQVDLTLKYKYQSIISQPIRIRESLE
jgi:hypothetical protein